MPDPFGHVHPGDKIRLGAQTFNTLMDCARDYKRTKRNVESGTSILDRNGTRIRIKNETGRDLQRFGIVALSDPLFLPSKNIDAFKREVTFRGVKPTVGSGYDHDYTGRFAIVDSLVAKDAICYAWVAGVCPVQIDIVNENDQTADVSNDDTTKLVSVSSGGSAQILWQDSGTGTQWAIVRIGNPQAQGGLMLAEDAGDGCRAENSGSARLIEDSSERTVSYTNPYRYSDVPDNSVMWLWYAAGTYKAVVWDCPAPDDGYDDYGYEG